MTIQKFTEKSSLISSIKLGRGSYIKVSNMPYTLQPIAIQNSLQHAVAVACKCYKTS